MGLNLATFLMLNFKVFPMSCENFYPFSSRKYSYWDLFDLHILHNSFSVAALIKKR